MDEAKELLEHIVRKIAVHPESVLVECKEDELGFLFTVTADAESLGYIIGKEGRTANALRQIIRMIGAKHGERLGVKINAPFKPYAGASNIDAVEGAVE